MKKVLFSVFITAFATANLFGNEKKLDSISPENSSQEKASVNCQIVTHVTVKDSRQNIIESYDVCTEGSGDQCKGAVNGQVFKQQTVRVAGIEP